MKYSNMCGVHVRREGMKGSEFWIPDLGLIEVFFFFCFLAPTPSFLFFLPLFACAVQCAVCPPNRSVHQEDWVQSICTLCIPID